jgi:hypothetical protein
VWRPGYQTFTVDGRDLDNLTDSRAHTRSLRPHHVDGDPTLMPKTTDADQPRQVNFESAPRRRPAAHDDD